MPNPIALAHPFFLLLMGVEIFFARGGGSRSTVSRRHPDLSCGMTSILLVFEVAALTGVTSGSTTTAWSRSPQARFWPWVIAFFAVDFTTTGGTGSRTG